MNAQALEKRAGEWPVWKWIVAAVREQVTPAAAIAKLTAALDKDEIGDVCFAIGTDDGYEVFRDNGSGRHGQTHATAHGMRTLRFLGALLDASGDDAALVFGRRVEKQLAQKTTFHLAAIATWAVATRAKRRKEAYPEELVTLATKSSTVGYGFEITACPAYHDVLSAMTERQRAAFVAENEPSFSLRALTDRVGPKERITPTLAGKWWYADLLPPAETATEMIAAVVGWDAKTKVPEAEVVDAIVGLGAASIAPLDAALARTPKAAHHKVLAAARKRLG